MNRERISLLLLMCLAGGCGYCGPRTVTRRSIDCNHYQTPAYVKDRIDVRQPRAYRTATYRWAHVRGPVDGLEVGQPIVVPVAFGEVVEPADDAVPPAVDTSAEIGDVLVPAPQPLPADAAAPTTHDSSDRISRREPQRTSWLFREYD